MTTDNRNPIALVIGAGDAIGSSVAKQFAATGMTVCMTRRDAGKLAPLIDELNAQGHLAHAFTSDARDEAQVVELFHKITTDIGPLGAVIFNIGANVPMSILETSSRKFRKIWEMACFAGFLNGREAAKYMMEQGHGTILFTGATASIRGGSVFAAFASAKHGLRALAQSMARELGPKNIHVGHIVIDAMVDTAWINDNFTDAVKAAGPEGIVNPDHLAKNYVMLHQQPRDSWTFELDVRPWAEKW